MLLLIMGVGMITFFQRHDMAAGIGVGLVLQAAFTLTLDIFAETRGADYLSVVQSIATWGLVKPLEFGSVAHSNEFNRYGSKVGFRTRSVKWFWAEHRLSLGEGPLTGYFLQNHTAIGLKKINQINELQEGNWRIERIFWRRRRDSNSRYRFKPICFLSREVPSTTRPGLQTNNLAKSARLKGNTSATSLELSALL